MINQLGSLWRAGAAAPGELPGESQSHSTW